MFGLFIASNFLRESISLSVKELLLQTSSTCFWAPIPRQGQTLAKPARHGSFATEPMVLFIQLFQLLFLFSVSFESFRLITPQ